MSSTQSQPPAGRGQLAAFRRQVGRELTFTDWTGDQLERRVVALEEVTAARWPRRWLLAARLRRQLRASVAPYRWAGPDFGSRRTEAIGTELRARW